MDAQEPVYGQVLAELRAGHKRTHWMWFIFPQIAGLGSSHNARRFALSGLPEARAYLGHATLGARLCQCTQFVLDIEDRSARKIFGDVDEMKFRSSMTLFDKAETGENPFARALLRYFDGQPDERTIRLLAS